MVPSPRRLALCAACALAAVAACDRGGSDLRTPDLTAGERRYVERVVVLERAKAVGLVDRARGAALCDSLAAAWGDSSLEATVAGLPDDPVRAAAVGRLLAGILQAEQDSLVLAPRADRLAAPLPAPAAVRPAAGETEP